MPELPEVRTVSYYLNKNLQSKKIIDLEIFLPKLIKEIDQDQFRNEILNQQILKVDNRAKFIVFFLSQEKIILSHLRMEGKYYISNKKPHRQKAHFIFHLDNGQFLTYYDTRQFGTFHLRTYSNYLKIKPLSNVGPIPADVIPKKLWERLQRKRVAIKTALLDQSLVSGIGNIYINEILWKEMVDPLTPSNQISLPKLRKILKTATEIMDQATELGGSTIKSFVSLNGREGQFQNFLKVHGKKGELCHKCQSEIEKEYVNGRGTYYCPKCQKRRS